VRCRWCNANMSILFQMSGFPRFTHVGSPPISADRGVDKQGDPFKSRPPLLPFFLFYICCLFFSFFRPQRKKKGRCERHPVSSSITLSFFVIASSVQFAVRRLIIIFADDLQSPPFAPLQILHNQLQKKKPAHSLQPFCCAVGLHRLQQPLLLPACPVELAISQTFTTALSRIFRFVIRTIKYIA
jgi:hypothetical protein